MKGVCTLAIEALSWMELEGLSTASALTKTATQLKIRDKRTIASARAFVVETLRRRNLVDKVVNNALAPSSLSDFNLGIQAFLRLYAYRTKFTTEGRDEAVKLAKIGRAVLGWRTIMLVEEALGKILALDPSSLLEDLDDPERMSLQTFNPTWFVEYCTRLLGRSEALKLLRKTRDNPQLFLCVNQLKAREDETLSKLSKHLVLEEDKDFPFLYRVVEKRNTLTSLEEYREGIIFPQNVATCLAVLAGKPRSGSVVFDIGATHGYKAIYTAILMGGKGRVISVDYPSRRIGILKQKLDRLGVNNVDVLAADVGEELPFKGEADLVYLSPPSSGSGAFWRIPTKWRDFKVVEGMVDVQWRMLNLSARCVRKGGCLVYSTPSILVEENELVIERFLKWHPEFVLDEVKLKLGVSGLRGQGEALRLYPHLHNFDGSYIAKLVRVEG